ncbi:MAG: urea transporter [Candidatus Eremiobacteraeota bacterium]|nr:urea transporter [Candidatus Eremiobacteraeota bacterium]
MNRRALEKRYREITRTRGLDFLDSLLRGAGQLFLCNNPLSGFLFLAALALLYPREALLGAIGLFVATLVCHLIYEKYWIVKNGLAGSNGLLVGLTMLIFPDMPFLIACGIVVAGGLMVALLIHRAYRYLGNYSPVQLLCFPSVIVSLVIIGLVYSSGISSPQTLAGWVTYSKGLYNDSVVLFNGSLQRNPRQAFVRDSLGWSYYRLDQHTPALREFSEALRLRPKLSDGFTGMGWCLFKMGDLDGALRNFKKALAQDAGAGDAYLGIGWIYYTRGDIRSARSFFTKALTLGGSLADSYIGLAWTYIKERSYGKAHSMLKKALFFKPDYRDASDAVEYLQSLPEYTERTTTFAFSVEEGALLLKRFARPYLLPFMLILLGILVHSLWSMLFALVGILFFLAALSLRSSCPEFGSVFFLYNLLASSVAFGGIQFVLSRGALAMVLVADLCCAFLWLILDRGFTPLGYPPLGLPCALTIFLLTYPHRFGLVPDGAAGLLTTGFDMISTSPERIVLWAEKLKTSSSYWSKIKALIEEKKTSLEEKESP